MALPARTSTDERRHVRAASRRRRRGGANRAPVVVQRIARRCAEVTGSTARRVSDTAARVRQVAVATVAGDRPFIVGLAVLLGVCVVMLSGPLQTYLDGRERVIVLERKRDALAEENSRLAERAEELHDPTAIELMAREQLGMVRPGEVPYALVPPEADRPQIVPQLEGEGIAEAPWYVRVWRGLTDLFG